jgi:hypothetical protein
MHASHIPIERPSVATIRRAAERLLQTERDVRQLPPSIGEWFMSKPGHRESFALARFTLKCLNLDKIPAVADLITEAANEVGR